MRRSLLRLLGAGAFTIPGAGGLQRPPVNQPAGQAVPLGVQPGVQGPVVRARLVIISGAGTAIEGVFEYQAGTTPAAGNPPVAWVTNSSADLFDNSLPETGIASAAWVGGVPAWSALSAGNVLLSYFGQGAASGLRTLGNANVQLSSGTQSGTDAAAAISLESGAASGKTGGLIALVADNVQLVATASADIPLAALSQFPISGSATLATTITAVNALYAALVTAGIFA